MFSGDDPDYHKPTDDAEKLDYELLMDNIKFILNLAKELANGVTSLEL
jgi:hypothetical protein